MAGRRSVLAVMGTAVIAAALACGGGRAVQAPSPTPEASPAVADCSRQEYVKVLGEHPWQITWHPMKAHPSVPPQPGNIFADAVYKAIFEWLKLAYENDSAAQYFQDLSRLGGRFEGRPVDQIRNGIEKDRASGRAYYRVMEVWPALIVWTDETPQEAQQGIHRIIVGSRHKGVAVYVDCGTGRELERKPFDVYWADAMETRGPLQGWVVVTSGNPAGNRPDLVKLIDEALAYGKEAPP